MIRRGSSALALLPLLAAASTLASDIKRDESVVFFPTAARLSDDGATWQVPIHGWIFEPERDDLLRNAALRELQHHLRLRPSQPDTTQFQKVARWLLVDNERGKRISIRIGERKFRLPPSRPNGHFRGTIELTAAAVNKLSHSNRLWFSAVTSANDLRRFTGTIHLVEPMGISVVSDIDDTIKVSQVHDKAELLRNTFLRQPRAVAGMAAAYAAWKKKGAQFHYVSSSPWQLYPLLEDFTKSERFPAGAWHLQQFRVKDETFLNLFADPVQRKTQVIEDLLTRYPQREFILVGDTGERDPEVYGVLARKHPNQILHICLRDVTGETRDSLRIQLAFADVPNDRWCLFERVEDCPRLAAGDES